MPKYCNTLLRMLNNACSLKTKNPGFKLWLRDQKPEAVDLLFLGTKSSDTEMAVPIGTSIIGLCSTKIVNNSFAVDGKFWSIIIPKFTSTLSSCTSTNFGMHSAIKCIQFSGLGCKR